jgi:hypothetical protein
MELYGVDSDEAMKRLTVHRFNFYEALKASSLQYFTQR